MRNMFRRKPPPRPRPKPNSVEAKDKEILRLTQENTMLRVESARFQKAVGLAAARISLREDDIRELQREIAYLKDGDVPPVVDEYLPPCPEPTLSAEDVGDDFIELENTEEIVLHDVHSSFFKQ